VSKWTFALIWRLRKINSHVNYSSNRKCKLQPQAMLLRVLYRHIQYLGPGVGDYCTFLVFLWLFKIEN